MPTTSISSPFPIFTDIDGQPLENGYIFIGVANLGPIGNPVNVYWDAALTIPAAQPIRTLGGYPVNNGTPAKLYVNSQYSIQVQNRNGSVIYSAPVDTEFMSSENVSYLPSGTGAVATTVQTKLRESVSVLDFGAMGNSNGASGNGNDDTAAIQAALDYLGSTGGGTVKLTKSSGFYRITSGLKIPSYVTLEGVAPSRFPFNGTGATSGLLADFSNANQWVIEPKTTSGGFPIAYNAIITGPLPSGTTYNCGVKNFQINVASGAVVPFGAVRMHGCPGSVVENVSAVGTGAGLLVNFCFGGNYSFHGLTLYYGVIAWSNANANNFEIYCTQQTYLNTVPAGYVMPFMSNLNGSMVSALKLTTEAHYNRSWGLIVGGTSSDTSTNNKFDITIEEFGGSVFQYYSYGSVFSKTYMESAASHTSFAFVGAQSRFTTASLHSYLSGTGVLFDLGVSVTASINVVGLISVGGYGTGPYLDTSSSVTFIGTSDSGIGCTPQFNILFLSDPGAWVAPTLLNSWVNAGSPNAVAGYCKKADGQIQLKGFIYNGSVGSAAFVLPAGYRPLEKRNFCAYGGTVTAYVIVLADGTVLPASPTLSAQGVSLDGISFKAEL